MLGAIQTTAIVDGIALEVFSERSGQEECGRYGPPRNSIHLEAAGKLKKVGEVTSTPMTLGTDRQNLGTENRDIRDSELRRFETEFISAV